MQTKLGFGVGVCNIPVSALTIAFPTSASSDNGSKGDVASWFQSSTLSRKCCNPPKGVVSFHIVPDSLHIVPHRLNIVHSARTQT